MSDDVIKIDIGKDFSRFPAGRTPDDGRYSGEAFREKFLKENLAESRKLTINLDNALSYGSSFLEEAFGGLVRVYALKAGFLRSHIEFISEDPFLIDEIWSYVDSAAETGSP